MHWTHQRLPPIRGYRSKWMICTLAFKCVCQSGAHSTGQFKKDNKLKEVRKGTVEEVWLRARNSDQCFSFFFCQTVLLVMHTRKHKTTEALVPALSQRVRGFRHNAPSLWRNDDTHALPAQAINRSKKKKRRREKIERAGSFCVLGFSVLVCVVCLHVSMGALNARVT